MYYKNHNMLSEQDWWASVKSQMQLPTQKVNEINEPTSDAGSAKYDPQEKEDNFNFEKLKLNGAKMKYRAFIDALKDMSNQNSMLLLKSFMEEFLLHTKLTPQQVRKVVMDVIADEHRSQIDSRIAQNKAAMEEQ
jgi:hypothetical protein